MATTAVIDDDSVFAHLLREVLTDAGYDTRVFRAISDVYEAEARESAGGDVVYQQLRAMQPDAIVLDIPVGRRVAALALLDAIRSDTALGARRLIICVPPDGPAGAASSLREAGYTTLVKPFDLDELVALIDHILAPQNRYMLRG